MLLLLSEDEVHTPSQTNPLKQTISIPRPSCPNEDTSDIIPPSLGEILWGGARGEQGMGKRDWGVWKILFHAICLLFHVIGEKDKGGGLERTRGGGPEVRGIGIRQCMICEHYHFL